MLNNPMGGPPPPDMAPPGMAPPVTAPPVAAAPRAKKVKAPTIDQVVAWAKLDQAYWDDRNKLMREWQGMYEMTQGRDPNEGEATVTLNDGRVIVDKLTAMLSNPHRKEVAAPADKPGLAEAAQRVENFLDFWRDEVAMAHSMGLHGPLEWDESQSLALRGYIAGRIMLDPENPGFPWKYDLLDIMNLYPRFAGRRLIRVTHQYKAKPYEIMADFPDAKLDYDPESEEDTDMEVIGYYDDTYHAVMVKGEFVKKPTPHEYGFNPILIVAAGGAFYGPTPEDDKDFRKMRGQSILAKNVAPILDKQDVVSMIKTILGQQADPPVTVFTDTDGNAVALDLGMAGRNVLAQTDKVEVHRIGAGLNELMGGAGVFQDEINRGGFMPTLFGDSESTKSGFHDFVASGSAKDVATPYVRALETYYKLLYRRVLQLYAKFGPQAISFYGTDQTGQVVSGLSITPEEVSKVGFNVNVKFRHVSAQDKVSLAQTGAVLARDRILSMETIRRDWVDVDNPYLENLRVLSELIYMNPQILQALSTTAAQLFNHPILNQVLAQQQAQAAQAAQAGQVPGQPPGQVPGAPPANPIGTQSQAVPPELGMNAGAPPGTDNLGPPGSDGSSGAAPDIMQSIRDRLGGMLR